MNTFKKFAAGLFALAILAGVANAQTTVRIVGSTAYRGPTHAAILKALGSTDGATLTSGSFGFTGSTFSSAGSAIFFGTISGTSVVIQTTWTGSEGGIGTVSAKQTISFLPTSTAVSNGSGTSGAADPTKAGNPSDLEIPDACMSDTEQGSSYFNGNYQGTLYPSLSEATGSPVGIVPFKWVATKGASGHFTNITSQLVRALFGGEGFVPLSMFSGSSTDTATSVYATGRDPDSGTRLTALAETGLGSQASVSQFRPLMTGTAGPVVITGTGSVISSVQPWPDDTYNTTASPVLIATSPNGGYPSGGQLAGALGSDDTSVSVPSGDPALQCLVGYLGLSDANNTALPGGAIELSYNGVLLGGNSATNYNTVSSLISGQYTFWNYEHMYFRSGAQTSAAVKSVCNTIAGKIGGAGGTAQVFTSNMQVSRGSGNKSGNIVSSKLE